MDLDVWPLAGLRVHTDRLELCFATDELLLALGEAATSDDFSDERSVPFLVGLSADDPIRTRRSILQFGWQKRAVFAPEAWSFNLAVLVEGEPVGLQEIRTKQFPVKREVESGSWLLQAHQGKGIGVAMRKAILQLAFAGLGAESAISEAFDFNGASLAVSRKAGYTDDGFSTNVVDDERVTNRRFRMTHDRWNEVSTDWPETTFSGLDPVVEQLGLDG